MKSLILLIIGLSSHQVMAALGSHCRNETFLAVYAGARASPILIACKDDYPVCDFEKGVCAEGFRTLFPCKGDGFYPNYNSCRRYILCLNEKAYKFGCKQGLAYDHKVKTCIPDESCTDEPNYLGSVPTLIRDDDNIS